MVLEFDQVIEEYHSAMVQFSKGNAAPIVGMLSPDASLAGGYGGFSHGRQEVAAFIEFAATQFREGKMEFESLARVETDEISYIVELETYRSKLGGDEEVSRDVLRVTSIFRREQGEWKLIHRHGDPLSAILALIHMLPRAVVSMRPGVKVESK